MKFLASLLCLTALLSAPVFAAAPDTFEPDHSTADPAADTPTNSLMLMLPIITAGTTQVRSLDVGGNIMAADRDFVSFTLAAPADVLIQTDLDVGAADTVVRLFNAAGDQIAFDDNGNPLNNGCSLVTAAGLTAGTYFISVEEVGLANGLAQVVESYRLTLLTAAPASAFAPVITNGLSVSGVKGTEFRFPLSAAGTQPVSFTASGLPAGLGLVNNEIFGIPTETGTFNVTLLAANGTGPGDTRNLALTITAFGIIDTLVGNGVATFNGNNRIGPETALNLPFDTAIDSAGNVFIADRSNNRIRKLDAVSGLVTTVAGGGAVTINDNTPATNGILNISFEVSGMAFDSAGNCYITDRGNNRIRKVDAVTGAISTVAGNGVAGLSGDGGQATSASLRLPGAVAVDAAGNLYIADSGNHCIRKVTAATGIITRLAGTGTLGNTGDGAAATNATLNSPRGLVVDPFTNTVFILDSGNNRIRSVGVNGGNIAHVAGSAAGTSGNTGDGGTLTNATFSTPRGLAFFGTSAASRFLYVADTGNNRVRLLGLNTNSVSNLAGSAAGTSGNTGDGAAATAALLSGPQGVAIDLSTNSVLVADTNNSRVRRILSGNISTFAGIPGATVVSGYSGDGGAATAARLAFPRSVAANGGTVYIADSNNNRVRAVASSTISTFAGGGAPGDQAAATSATLSSPNGITVAADGTLYISDTGNNRIRKVDPVSGTITTVAGTGPSGYFGDGGAATLATLSSPVSTALTADNRLLICDTSNHVIRSVNLGTGVISTVAGNGTSGFSGDTGSATAAQLSFPGDVDVAPNGDIYIADTSNHVVRRVSGTTITTAAGTGTTAGFSGDGGQATAARLSSPRGVTLDAQGLVYITDSNNNRVRRYDPADGILSTIAGSGGTGVFSGDGFAGTQAQLSTPRRCSVDASGGLYITDSSNHRVRRVANASAPAITSALTASGTKNQLFQYRITATGHPLPTFAANNLPQGLLLVNGLLAGFPVNSGAFDIELIAFNQLGSDVKTLRVSIGNGLPANTAPVFSTQPVNITASSNPGLVGQTINFAAPTAGDADGDALAYDWDFGDGQTASGPAVSHVYATTGLFTVTLTVTDGNATAVATLSMAVNAASVTEKIITDKFQVKFAFTAANKDSLTLAGRVPLRAGYNVNGSQVRCFLGPLQKQFTLNAKGGVSSKTDVIKLAFKQKPGSFIDVAKQFYSGKFQISLKGQTLFTTLQSLGFTTNQLVPVPVKVPVLISVDNDFYADTVTTIYKSNGKTGSGVKVNEGDSIPTR